jgi:putative phage-type endonuclease
MLISELEDLEDILDSLLFEDEPTIFTEDYAIDLIDTALYLMDEFVTENPHIISEPDFNEILLEEIKEIFETQMEDVITSDCIEDDLNDLIEHAFSIFIILFNYERTTSQTICETHEQEVCINNDIIEEKIKLLREIPQPHQRTPEWYQFRWNLITASNAWKAFESQSTVNQLIYEKCLPLKTYNENEPDQNKMVNTNTPLHWGQKYEPLTILLYEDINKTKIEDFGCIAHPVYKFLGASPDGINVDKNSDRYGRMLEIKNVVSREINGNPKKEYWIQMQLQMEVCNLDECDFVETKFVEYTDAESFHNDSKIDDNGDKTITLTKDNKTKGVILYFHTKECKPFYSYKPLNIISPNDISTWEEHELEKYESEPYNYVFFKFIYWKLEVLSCVLVLRNREWFKNNISTLEKVWNTIETERVTGYEHRAPNKKPKKEQQQTKPFIESQGCLLKFNKIIKVDTDFM